MVDPVSVSVVAASAYLGKKGLARLLGPATDKVAEALARYAEFRLRNIGRIVENADRKAVDLAGQPGVIPMRVAMRILDEGSYSEDDIVVEYLGGILASSRSPFGRDDRGNTLTALVSRLSTYHLRAHYYLYSEVRRLLVGSGLNLHQSTSVLENAVIHIPISAFTTAMDFDASEPEEAIFYNTMHTLSREELVNVQMWGPRDHLQNQFVNLPEAEPALIFMPTPDGAELYLWGLGHGQLEPNRMFDPDLALPEIPDLELPPEAVVISKRPLIGAV